MIPYSQYKSLKALAEKLKMPSDKEAMRNYVKLAEHLNQDIQKEVFSLQKKNKVGRIQHGQTTVDKKTLLVHLATCKKVISGIDTAMKQPSDYYRGQQIAALANELENSLFIFSMSANSISSVEDKAEAEQKLLAMFYEKQDDLLLKAAFDDTKRRNIQFSLDHFTGFGGTVNYNKKESRFDKIEYVIGGYGHTIDL